MPIAVVCFHETGLIELQVTQRQVTLSRNFYPLFLTSAQVVLAFPAVLEKLRVDPFDLGQLVAPVLAAEPGLPADLACHLSGLEERIMEVCTVSTSTLHFVNRHL